MTIRSIFLSGSHDDGLQQETKRRRDLPFLVTLLLAGTGVCFSAGLSGCSMPAPETTGVTPATQSNDKMGTPGQREVLTIHEGDVLKISFPSSANLDSTQQVRRDGRITLAMVGEIVAAGMTPTDLEKELIERYASQLVSKEVSVTVVSTSFAVYVSGAVLRPGKIAADRPITALEAIMEAGGFDSTKADAKAVVVIRQEEGKTRNFTLNLKTFLEGKAGEPFYLKSADIIYVPEKFSWF